MINVIFRTQKGFNTYPNELLSINPEYAYENGSSTFGNLSQTNIFIGENNSGKSRFLRFLFENGFLSIDEKNIDEFCSDMKKVVACGGLEEKNGYEKFNLIYEKAQNNQNPFYGKNHIFFERLKAHSHSVQSKNKYYFPPLRGLKNYKAILDAKLKKFLNSATSIQNKDAINHYISLLNLESEGLDSFDIYREIIMHEYFSEKSLNIVTGGDLYKKIKSMLLGKEIDRKLIAEFQDFLKNNFFFEYESVQLIPNEDKKVLYVKIGNDERPIYDWGDGTQQLIIILFSLFIHKDKPENLFFIEEPEMYLHPGLLRKFIEVINSELFSNHQYFITTHSNVILDTSADLNIKMSIFKFAKKKNEVDEAKFLIEQCNNGDVSLLSALGVRNSSVFLANCSIWVEGITDRLYLKHYLKLYFKKKGTDVPFRENIDYTFIEYGGNNITHFNFAPEDLDNSINAKYINNRIFLIADNDNTKPGTKRTERKTHLKTLLQDNFHELTVTEIENLLSQTVIEKILIKQNSDCENVIHQKFAGERKYKTRKLGTYLDGLFKNTEVKKYAGESGTIKNKLAFCQTAITVLTDYDMLSTEARELTERVAGFITSNCQ